MRRSPLPAALLLVLLAATSASAVPARSSLSAETRPATSYLVKKGDSLSTIARRHGLSVATLKQLNGLKGDALKPGQVLHLRERTNRLLPATRSALTQLPPAAPASRTETATYKVKKGDSLSTIARRNGLSVATLKSLNGLKGDALKPGQRLLLGQAAARPAPEAIVTGPDPAALLRQVAATPADQPEYPSDILGAAPDSLEEVAYTYLATPYRFGGSSRKGIDCSSFVQSVFRQLNLNLPRTAREQYQLGTEVDQTDLQSGDLLFFRTYAKYPSHVGIYLGDQKMIHASPRSRRVVISSVDTPYFRARFIGAKRLAMLNGHLDVAALTHNVEEVPEATIEEEAEPAAPGSGN